MNFRDPKDYLPLPNIEILVDSNVGYEMLSLMDGFLGYNQIRVVPKYQHKIAFIMLLGT